MIFESEKELLPILRVLREAGRRLNVPLYIVGGAVRDKILFNKLVRDIDVVCVGNGIELAKQVQALLPEKPRLAVYRRFGTAMLNTSGFQLEFVGARKESYSPNSRKPAVESGTLEDDQRRRDFTINAMAVSLSEESYGKLLDPFNGMEHLKQKLIKTPLDPHQTFSDDPLRMLRAIRFAATLHFRIDPDTFRAIHDNRQRIEIVSQERIAGEIQRIMMADKPSEGWILMFKSGLLELVFPELYAMHGVEVKGKTAHKDNFYHTMQVLDNVAAKTDNVWLRWAALLHDIGKPLTKRWSEDTGWTFHGHDAVGANMVRRIFKRFRFPLGQQMEYVRKLVRLHQRPMNLTGDEITDSAIRRIIFESGEDLDDLLLLCECDMTTKSEEKRKRYLDNYRVFREKVAEVEARDHLRNWKPPVTGEDIMAFFGIPPGRVVGVIKEHIKESILEGVIPNEREAALEEMKRKGLELGLTPQAPNLKG